MSLLLKNALEHISSKLLVLMEGDCKCTSLKAGLGRNCTHTFLLLHINPYVSLTWFMCGKMISKNDADMSNLLEGKIKDLNSFLHEHAKVALIRSYIYNFGH